MNYYEFKKLNVHKQTPSICLAAVIDSGYALEFIVEQTPNICLTAVRNNGLALMYVKYQTDDVCLAA